VPERELAWIKDCYMGYVDRSYTEVDVDGQTTPSTAGDIYVLVARWLERGQTNPDAWPTLRAVWQQPSGWQADFVAGALSECFRDEDGIPQPKYS
jgi:hypothetical protein